MGAHSQDSTAGPAGGRLSADLSAHVEAIVHAAEREARIAEQAIAEHRRSAEEEVRRYLAAARLHVDAETAARTARIETLSAAARRLADELTDAVAALTRELQADDQHAEARLPRAPWPATPAPQAEPMAAVPPPPAAAPPAPPTPAHGPTWSRIESEPAAAPSPSAADADRVGGGEDARPPAEGPVGAHPEPTGPARSSVGPADAEPASPNGGDASNGASEIPVPSAARLVAIEMAVGGSSRAEVEEHLRGRLGVAEPEPLLDDVFGAASHAGSRLAWGEP
ncbi:MAG TPA: hypothetical protein VGO48_01755 [Conexibacter sp.]|jgi:hypothetical protein|nr:hypothetical protein [Conexibacter sp.]